MRNFLWPFYIRQLPTEIAPQSFLEWRVIVGTIFILGTLILAFTLRNKNKVVTFLILAYWVALAPTSSIIPLHAGVVDYRPYPALIFLILILNHFLKS